MCTHCSELCPMCECAHYSQNYAGIIGTSLVTLSLSLLHTTCHAPSTNFPPPLIPYTSHTPFQPCPSTLHPPLHSLPLTPSFLMMWLKQWYVPLYTFFPSNPSVCSLALRRGEERERHSQKHNRWLADLQEPFQKQCKKLGFSIKM